MREIINLNSVPSKQNKKHLSVLKFLFLRAHLKKLREWPLRCLPMHAWKVAHLPLLYSPWARLSTVASGAMAPDFQNAIAYRLSLQITAPPPPSAIVKHFNHWVLVYILLNLFTKLRNIINYFKCLTLIRKFIHKSKFFATYQNNISVYHLH